MAQTWLSIQVELVQGRGETYWPRPGRAFAASRSHTFEQLAAAIDDAFARWDRSHLWAFMWPDGTRIEQMDVGWIEVGQEGALDGATTKLSRLSPGERFLYEFDFGDGWLHVCTVGKERIDPVDRLGIVPTGPLPYWGWGSIPDQYGRRWAEDDGESDPLPDPGTDDLEGLFPDWGPPDGHPPAGDEVS